MFPVVSATCVCVVVDAGGGSSTVALLCCRARQVFMTFADFGFKWPSVVRAMFNIAGVLSLNFKVQCRCRVGMRAAVLSMLCLCVCMCVRA